MEMNTKNDNEENIIFVSPENSDMNQGFLHKQKIIIKGKLKDNLMYLKSIMRTGTYNKSVGIICVIVIAI